jgi:protein TonB
VTDSNNIVLLKDQHPHNRIIWAVGLSILLHGMALLLIPRLKIDEVKQPETLTVELATPQVATPASEEAPAEPEPPSPPEPPKPVTKTKPVVKSVTQPSLEKAPPPTEATEISQPVITAPKTEAPAIVSAPAAPTAPSEPAVSAPKPGPSQRDLDNARNLYGNMLSNAISKYKQYPRVAQIRGWEGQVDLEIEIDSNGNVLATRILQSSGHEILDKQALEMVKKASPLPPPPDALRGRTFTVFVPIPFRLEN